MQDGAPLGDVDLLAPKHGVDVLAQPGLLRKLKSRRIVSLGDSVLRVVEVQTDGLQREMFAALGIVGEELPEV